MRPGVVIRVLVAGMLAAGTLAVAACGGDDATGDAASTAERERREAALNYARCMREHGVDMPDPTVAAGAMPEGPPDEDAPPEKLREAEQACREYDPEANAPTLSEEEQQEFREAALAHARCMREHGIEDFPDPQVNERGAYLPKAEGRIDENDPDFREAMQACRDTAPPKPSAETAP